MYYKQCTGVILIQKTIDVPDWVSWTHHSMGESHCEECLTLDGCFFVEDNHPPCPHHPYCHCTVDPIDYSDVLDSAYTTSDYSKFDPYLEVNSMKEMDCVEIIVEKEKYAEDGVHKGMQGWICLDECRNGWWLVDFPRYGEKDDIAMISVKEEDMRLLPNGMSAKVNERIEAEYNDTGKTAWSSR